MKKLFYLFIAIFCLVSCNDEEIEVDGPNGYRLIYDRVYASYNVNTVYFIVDKPDQKAPFERYVINAKGEKIKVCYKENNNDPNPNRAYTTTLINDNNLLVDFECSTPLVREDSASFDILEFESGRVDTIKTLYKMEFPDNLPEDFCGGTGVILKKAWYNGNLFYDDFKQTDTIVVSK